MFRPVLAFALAGLVCLTFTRPGKLRADVVMGEPSFSRLGMSDIVAVVAVLRVEGIPPFHNGSPPPVLVRVLDPIKGCSQAEVITVTAWVTGPPQYSHRLFDEATRAERIRSWEDSPCTPPSIGDKYFVCMQRKGEKDAMLYQGGEGPVATRDPTPRLVQWARGSIWIHVAVEPVDTAAATLHPAYLRWRVTNRSQARIDFDLREWPPSDVEAPWGNGWGGPWKCAPPKPLNLGPGETRSCEIRLDSLIVPNLPVPGQYRLVWMLPANVDERWDGLDVRFVARGEASTSCATLEARLIVAATVDSVIQHPDRADWDPLSGDQQPAQYRFGDMQELFNALPLSLPTEVLHPGRKWRPRVNWDGRMNLVEGKRYLFFCTSAGWVFLAQEATPDRVWEVNKALPLWHEKSY